MDFDSYLAAVRERLANAGFDVGEASGGVALMATRRQFKVTRFGLVDTVVGVSRLRPEASPADLRVFGGDMYHAGIARKSRIPRGLGSSLVVYPVLVVQKLAPELREYVAEYVPKHWAALEFPVVVELSSDSLVHLETTPFWGSAYYRRTRGAARDLFGTVARRPTHA